jgi:tetratricopeptide (TPR) repeat protein
MGSWAAGELLDSDAQRALASRRTPSMEDLTALDPAGVPGRGDLLLLAWHGHEAEARSVAADHIRSAIDDGAGLGVSTAQYAMVILELGLGRYEAALGSALKVYRDDPPYLGTHVLPDLIEAAIRAGNSSAARSALERLAERALASGTALAAGLLARSRALLATSTGAESLYQEAIEHLRKASETAQVARAHLLYGE